MAKLTIEIELDTTLTEAEILASIKQKFTGKLGVTADDTPADALSTAVAHFVAHEVWEQKVLEAQDAARAGVSKVEAKPKAAVVEGSK